MATRKRAPKSRVNMRVRESLLEWAKEYADRNETNVTRLFTEHLLSLQKREQKHAAA